MSLALLVALSAYAQELPGDLQIYVFLADSGTPAPELELYWDDAPAGATDALGSLSLQDSPGHHRLRIDDEEVDVYLGAGETTEVLVTWGDPPVFRISAPSLAQREDVQATAATVLLPIAGHVRDTEGSPLSEARIFVRGRDTETTSANDGAFTLSLPEGTWDLSVLLGGYATQSLTVAVAPDIDPLDVRLSPEGLALDAFVVAAPRIEGGAAELLAERQQSATVSDGIGAEQMSKSGDGNAAAALRRVTGLTVVGGRYVYVRGLGDRYSTTLLNGANLPSPEPERRVVPLDLFPSGILEKVVVQKSYSPDLPGEFGGGAVRLDTRGVPEERVFKVSLSGGYTSRTSFARGIGYQGGPGDFFGVDGGWRALPEPVQQASDASPLEETDMFSDRGYTAAELETLGEAMPNRWDIRDRTLPPDFGIAVTAGDSHEIGGRPLGWMIGLSYANNHNRRLFDRYYYALGANAEMEPSHQYAFNTVNNRVQTGLIATVGTSPWEGHTLSSTTLLLRSTDDETRVYQGFNRDVATEIRVSRLRFVERQLLFQQLRGEHPLASGPNATSLDWRYAFAWAKRGEPDRRETRYDLESASDDLWLLSDRPEGNQRFFSDLGDIGHDGGLGLAIPIRSVTVKTGLAATSKRREVDTRRFKYMHKGPDSRLDTVLSGTPEEAFSPENVGANGFQFEETTRQTDNYLAGQNLLGAFAMAEGGLGERLRLMGGVRVERSAQTVTTYELFNPDAEPVVASLVTTDVLPAATGTLVLTDPMQLRAGYGRTLSRPDFREMSPATFNDVTGGRQTFGNPELDRAIIDHVDLRWEWFPSAGEVLAVSGFFKHFNQPVESIVVVSAQQSVSYDNADSATNIGFELEARKDLPANLYLSGNASLIRSRVVLGENEGIQTSTERPLQGQSPYVFNVQAGYDDPDRGHSLSVLYNVFGPRITEVGALGAPDVYEQPFHRLDAVATLDLPAGFKLGMKARNLLDATARRTQGGEVTEEMKPGWSVGIGISWTAPERSVRRPEPLPIGEGLN